MKEVSYQFKIKSLLPSASPKSQQKSGIGVHSGLDSRDEIARSTGLDHGEETGGGESSICASEILCCIELVGEVLECSWRAVQVQVSLSSQSAFLMLVVPLKSCT